MRRRLARAVWVGSLVCAAAVSVGVWLATQEEVDELLDDTLQASAEVLGDLLRDHKTEPARGAIEVRASSRFAWQVVDASQRVLARSGRAPDAPLSATPTAGFFDAAGWRVYGSALGGGRTLYVAQTRAERAEAQLEVATKTVLAALAVSLLGYFWLRARLRHELMPLQHLS